MFKMATYSIPKIPPLNASYVVFTPPLPASGAAIPVTPVKISQPVRISPTSPTRYLGYPNTMPLNQMAVFTPIIPVITPVIPSTPIKLPRSPRAVSPTSPTRLPASPSKIGKVYDKKRLIYDEIIVLLDRKIVKLDELIAKARPKPTTPSYHSTTNVAELEAERAAAIQIRDKLSQKRMK